MGFEIQNSRFYLGDTRIENIFINEYMPSAPAQYVKIYILAYSYAQNNDKHLDIFSIARILDLSLVAVLEAFQYWKDQGILDIVELSDSEEKIIEKYDEISSYEDIEIRFKNINDIYINHIHKNAQSLKSNIETYSNTTSLADKNMGSNASISINAKESQNLFANTLVQINTGVQGEEFKSFLDKLITMRHGKILSPEAIRRLSYYNYNLGLSIELLQLACEISYDNPNVRESNHLNYAHGILNNFYEANIFTVEEYYNRKRQNSYSAPSPEELGINKPKSAKTQKFTGFEQNNKPKHLNKAKAHQNNNLIQDENSKKDLIEQKLMKKRREYEQSLEKYNHAE